MKSALWKPLPVAPFVPGSSPKRFVRQLAGRDRAKPLSDRQRAYLWAIAWSWRRQLPRGLVELARTMSGGGPTRPRDQRSPYSRMIHYHGGRHSTWQVAVEIWKRRHSLVSFADPQQIVIAAEVAQSFALDNGAFSVWKQSVEVNWLAYYEWVEQWWRHPGFDWALIPDVIDGDAAANGALLEQWPFPKTAGVPVWHFHESLDRLSRLAAEWPRVALGSSGQYATIGTPKWRSRMQQVMESICEGGRPRVKLHGLRMLRPAICKYLPIASADSAGMSRGVGTTNWGGSYRHASEPVRGQVLLDSYESAQSAAAWAGIPAREELFG